MKKSGKSEDGIMVELSKPITVHGETIDSLRFTDPTVGDLKRMYKVTGEMEQTAVLIETMAGIPADAVDQIVGRDLVVISKIIAGFLTDSRPTRRT